MNFSVTGEPVGNPLDQKRKQLLSSLLSGRPGQQRLLAAGSGRGLAKSFGAADAPNAAVPGLGFNPFLAQLQRGVGGLNAPTAGIRQQINDISGGPQGPQQFGIPSVQQAQPTGNGAPVPDPGPQGGGGPAANPQDLSSLMGAAGVLGGFQEGQGGGYGFLGLPDPSQLPPPPISQLPPIGYTRGGRNVAY
jgi:hypothetical protein